VECCAVRCSVVQCGAVWCSVVQCGAVRCIVSWTSCSCVLVVCCSVLQCVAVYRGVVQSAVDLLVRAHRWCVMCCTMLQCVAHSLFVGAGDVIYVTLWHSVAQCVAVYCRSPCSCVLGLHCPCSFCVSRACAFSLSFSLSLFLSHCLFYRWSLSTHRLVSFRKLVGLISQIHTSTHPLVSIRIRRSLFNKRGPLQHTATRHNALQYSTTH